MFDESSGHATRLGLHRMAHLPFLSVQPVAAKDLGLIAWIDTIMIVISWIFVYLFIPETAGIPLETLDDLFAEDVFFLGLKKLNTLRNPTEVAAQELHYGRRDSQATAVHAGEKDERTKGSPLVKQIENV
jgi:hypothetical protein